MSSKGCTEKCFTASIERVRSLLEVGAEVDKEDDRGYTPLCIAAEQGNTELVVLLAANGANINHWTCTDATPFYLAAANLKRETALVLRRLGGDITSRHIYRLSLTSYRVLDVLMDCGVNLHKSDSDGWTGLHWAANEGNVDGILALLDIGLNIEARTSCGWTPLHMASVNLNCRAVVTLLNHGADKTKRDKDGNTPLDLAVQQGGVNIRLVNFIMQAMSGYLSLASSMAAVGLPSPESST